MILNNDFETSKVEVEIHDIYFYIRVSVCACILESDFWQIWQNFDGSKFQFEVMYGNV